jgi:hypothetical protein
VVFNNTSKIEVKFRLPRFNQAGCRIYISMHLATHTMQLSIM